MNKDIAIIGISGRFPMARNLGELFENLRQGKDCVDDISPQRIIDTALPSNRSLRKCGYLDDIDKFDYKFFGISLAEAKNMCPEQRILMEIAYACMENAGYSPASFSGTDTAVFVSTAFPAYYQHATERTHTLLTGNATEFLAAKIGRFFNLKGTAAVIDTTCSSSLVAIHTACNEMITGDASMALVAGVNLVLFPFSDEPGGLDTEAPNGKSKAFSAEADGMSYGEVAAAVLLKPLDAAIRDKDNIHAIIKGTAANYNGNGSSAITAPDSRTQADVFLKAWKKAGIKATDLSFVEAHGSGTQLGDTLEFEALNLAFREYTTDRHICPISTIKSNMGHGRYVSGLAGLIKTILSLKYKVLFPTIHFKVPNPLLDHENSAVYVNREYTPWETPDKKPRYAGVTSLGWSGTNCHVVLQEGPAPVEDRTDASLTCFHIPLSGKTPESLQQNAAALLAYLGRDKVAALEDISYTLTTGRNHFEYRLSFVASTIDELTKALNQDLKNPHPFDRGRPKKLIFIFSDSRHLTDAIIEKLMNY
jgi:acyl transferase domain-containing protein